VSEAALVVRGVHVEHRRRPALDVAELTIAHGETLSIVGPNGAGKSTLLRVLGLLEAPQRGEVWFRGELVTWAPAQLLRLRRRMAIVFQDPLLCRTTVARNVSLGLEFRGVDRHERRQRVGEWLERLGIAHLADRPAHRISGGEAQRASLARAFVLQPEVLLLDEPFSALDPPTRQALAGDLQQLLAETQTSTVFVTHDRDEAVALGNRVAVMLSGTVAQVGSPDDVAQRPANEAVARFFGMDTLFPGVVVDAVAGTATIAVGALRFSAASSFQPGQAVWACLRSEDVSIHVSGSVAAPSEWNVAAGTVSAMKSWGTQVRVAVDCGVTVTALTTRLAASGLALKPGRAVRVAFSPHSIHTIPRGS
jgi:tungstate transport system ATP-binding protein